MTEPDVALTDYALALECAVFACSLARAPSTASASPTGRSAGWLRMGSMAFFAFLALAAVCGGTLHGFYLDGSAPGHSIWWKSALLAMGAAVSAGWVVAACLLVDGCGGRRVFGLAALAFVVYAGLVLGVVADFRLALAGCLIITPALLAGFVRASRRPGSPPRIRLAVWGLVLSVVGAALQQLQLGLHPRWFNHNAVYHAVEAVALALIFAGTRALLRPPGALHADAT